MTSETQQSIQQAQATISRMYDETRAYIPALLGQMGKTYLPPLIAVFIMGTLGAELFIQWGGWAGNMTALLLNVFILLLGFRWTENRFKGTNLFVAYVAVGRIRRELKTMIEAEEPPAAALIHAKTDEFQSVSEGFITAMQAQGAQPVELK